MAMRKNKPSKTLTESTHSISKLTYKKALLELQVELVKMQRHIIKQNEKVLIILEGRDAAGKDGTIKRIIKHLSPRETRVVALSKPTERDCNSWYFQRYVAHLPSAQELVIFNRSWYNRAGVERVMGFCTEDEYMEFMGSVKNFENMLVGSGVQLIKYYLDIGRSEQKRRLKNRKTNPFTQWKTSPIDDQAVKHWKEYSEARNKMLAQSHHSTSPWMVVRANDKRLARINLIKDLLGRFPYEGKDRQLIQPNPKIVFAYDDANLENGQIAQ